MSEKQVKCSHCGHTGLEVVNPTIFKCKKCEKLTKVTQAEENLAVTIAKRSLVCVGVGTVLYGTTFLLGGPPGLVLASAIISTIVDEASG